jgi:hypothetical protein
VLIVSARKKGYGAMLHVIKTFERIELDPSGRTLDTVLHVVTDLKRRGDAPEREYVVQKYAEKQLTDKAGYYDSCFVYFREGPPLRIGAI